MSLSKLERWWLGGLAVLIAVRLTVGSGEDPDQLVQDEPPAVTPTSTRIDLYGKPDWCQETLTFQRWTETSANELEAVTPSAIEVKSSKGRLSDVEITCVHRFDRIRQGEYRMTLARGSSKYCKRDRDVDALRTMGRWIGNACMGNLKTIEETYAAMDRVSLANRSTRGDGRPTTSDQQFSDKKWFEEQRERLFEITRIVTSGVYNIGYMRFQELLRTGKTFHNVTTRSKVRLPLKSNQTSVREAAAQGSPP